MHRSGLKCSPSMFIERMNTLSAILVPQLYSLIITGRHNQTIVWRKPARNLLEIVDQKLQSASDI